MSAASCIRCSSAGQVDGRSLLSYEVLDHIADSVNPTLGLLAIGLPWLRPYRERPPLPLRRVGGAVLCVGLAYAGQAFDKFTGLWPALSMDYSGHSAVCVAWLVSIAYLSRRW